MTDQPPKPWYDLDRWLARLSFPFLIFAVILALDSIRALQGAQFRPAWRIWTQFAFAAICLILGLIGIRARHRA